MGKRFRHPWEKRVIPQSGPPRTQPPLKPAPKPAPKKARDLDPDSALIGTYRNGYRMSKWGWREDFRSDC